MKKKNQAISFQKKPFYATFSASPYVRVGVGVSVADAAVIVIVVAVLLCLLFRVYEVHNRAPGSFVLQGRFFTEHHRGTVLSK